MKKTIIKLICVLCVSQICSCGTYDIAFVYDFHNEQPSVYNDYLEFCDKYDLPISNIMTQEVLGY